DDQTCEQPRADEEQEEEEKHRGLLGVWREVSGSYRAQIAPGTCHGVSRPCGPPCDGYAGIDVDARLEAPLWRLTTPARAPRFGSWRAPDPRPAPSPPPPQRGSLVPAPRYGPVAWVAIVQAPGSS